MDLPQFPYSPNAYQNGAVVRSDDVCPSCGERRGWVAAAPANTGSESLQFCPWCIADGSAHEKFDATFNDATSDGATYRTPGFATWQDWQWPDHCGETAAYLGQPRAGELRRYPDAVEGLRADLRDLRWSADEMEELIDALDPERSAVAYLFQCRRCAAHLAVWDVS